MSSASLSLLLVSDLIDTTAGLTRSTRSAKLKGALSSMRGVAARGVSFCAIITGAAAWTCSTGGNSAKAPRPTTTMEAAVVIAIRRR
jgi:hypothetical protein